MADDNIFSGLKVVDFASFIAGPSAAVILSDFGADVIKVEAPVGRYATENRAQDPATAEARRTPIPGILHNRNKRGTARFEISSRRDAQHGARALLSSGPMYSSSTLRTQRTQETQAGVRGRRGQWNPRPDLCGSDRLRRKRARRGSLPGFDITSYWGAERIVGADARRRRAAHSGQWPAAGIMRQPLACFPLSSWALYRRERTGKGSYVTTSLLGHRCLVRQALRSRAALCGAKFYGPHDRLEARQCRH